MAIDFTTMKADIKAYIADVIVQTKAFVIAHLPHWGVGAGLTLAIQFVLSHTGDILAIIKSVL